MKVSTAALPFLILAAALGHLAHGSPPDELGSAMHVEDNSRRLYFDATVSHHVSDCCFSYTRQNIRCIFMQNYYKTSSGCSLPAVIFKTRGRKEVCFDPDADGVQECMEKLDSANTWRTVG